MERFIALENIYHQSDDTTPMLNQGQIYEFKNDLIKFDVNGKIIMYNINNFSNLYNKKIHWLNNN